MKQYSVKLNVSPFEPGIEIAGDLVIKMHVPYSDQIATIQVNPNITDHRPSADVPGMKIRQVTETRETSETQTLQFELKKRTTHQIAVGQKMYVIELVNIGYTEKEGQKFKSYEFEVIEK